MPDNELMYGLIGASAVGVVMLVGYNAWQERRHRRQAERAFRSEHRDVLLEGAGEAPAVGASAAAVASPPSPPPPLRPAPAIGRVAEPELPAAAQAVDCVVRIEAPAGVRGGQLVTQAGGPLAPINRPLRWYGLCEETHRWLNVTANDARSYTRLAVALQVADRRGPLSERELDAFLGAIQRVCDQFLAVPHCAEREDTLALAQNVDKFCAAVDIQIAINVIAGEHPFQGTKLRGLAEASGLVLDTDGAFHARDEHGGTLYVMSNRDASLFSVDALREMICNGVTLSLDVPRVAHGAQVFERMLQFARQLASTLGGTVVDDNRKPLSEASTSLIRSQIQQFQEQMERQGIPAGSSLAQRLFV